MASHTVSFSIRLAWQLKPSPMRCPAAGMHLLPVCVATLPWTSTSETWRVCGSESPGPHVVEAKRAEADVHHRLRCHSAHARFRPRHDADLEIVGLDGDCELP